LTLARLGIATIALVELVRLAAGFGWSPWTLVPGLVLAAAGMRLLATSARRMGEPHAWCGSLLLAATAVGLPLAPWGGTLLLGAAWLATAASIWSAFGPPLRPALTQGA
jgi:hypothetical protein